MKLLKNYRLYALTLLCVLVLGGIAGYAQNYTAGSSVLRPQIKLALSGVVEREGKNLPLTDAGRVNSGEILDWKIVSTNSGSSAATSHEAIGQIPAGTTFVADSASSEASAAISYSIDGGKTFSAHPMISSKQANGSVKEVPAPVSSYTQVRYHWDTPLVTSDSRSASYKVRVN